MALTVIVLPARPAEIASCNGCHARNYDSSLAGDDENRRQRRDSIFALTYGAHNSDMSHTVTLCATCLVTMHRQIAAVVSSLRLTEGRV